MSTSAAELPVPLLPAGFTFGGWAWYAANELHAVPYFVASVHKDGARARMTLDEPVAASMPRAGLEAYVKVQALHMVSALRDFLEHGPATAEEIVGA